MKVKFGKMSLFTLELKRVHTGVRFPTIVRRTSHLSSSKSKTSLLAGYVFKRLDDKTPFEHHSVEEAIFSRNEYFSEKKKLAVTDLKLNTTKIYDRVMDFAAEVGRCESALHHAIRVGGTVAGRYKLRMVLPS